ncbi:DUF3316 domain-containing protein [Vibrio sp. PP-XX7]
MNKLVMITALLFMSSSVFAATTTQYSNTHFDVGAYNSKVAAYQAGFQHIEKINDMSQAMLKFELPVFGIHSGSHVVIDGTSVKLEEFEKTQGNVAYRSIINVDYHYKVRRH